MSPLWIIPIIGLFIAITVVREYLADKEMKEKAGKRSNILPGPQSWRGRGR